MRWRTVQIFDEEYTICPHCKHIVLQKQEKKDRKLNKMLTVHESTWQLLKEISAKYPSIDAALRALIYDRQERAERFDAIAMDNGK